MDVFITLFSAAEPLRNFFLMYLGVPLVVACVIGMLVRNKIATLLVFVIPLFVAIFITVYTYSTILKAPVIYPHSSILETSVPNRTLTVAEKINSILSCLEGETLHDTKTWKSLKEQGLPPPPTGYCLKNFLSGIDRQTNQLLINISAVSYMVLSVIWPILSLIMFRLSGAYFGLEAASKGVILGSLAMGLYAFPAFVGVRVLFLPDLTGLIFFLPLVISGVYFVIGIILLTVFFFKKRKQTSSSPASLVR